MMKTPDVIKKGLRECGKIGDCEVCPYYEENKMVQCVTKLVRDTLELIGELEKPGWISVEDALPAKYKPVIVCREYDAEGAVKIEQGMLTDGGWWKVHGTNVKKGLTHWMPLPEPPKE